MKMEKSCGAILCRETEELPQVLLIRHKNGGHWGFPKGHVEDRETEEETARREIWEETGLKAKLDTGFRKVVTYSPKPRVMKDVVYFAARPSGGALKRQEAEVEETCWATLGQALDLVTFETDRDVLRAFIAYYERD
jgi:bis(5'-nucleosidyl)-tetraphosphatase